MHYRHAFHAGNFADVWKHCILFATLTAMNRKAAPWSYLESHAGAGCYGLDDARAGRTGEWLDGIGRLRGQRDSGTPIAPLLRDFLDCLEGVGPGRYPGSPWLAAQLARAGDELLLCESQAPVAAELSRALQGAQPRPRIQQRDGYGLDSLLPPRHPRVVFLVDPPFERRDELDAVAALVQRCLGRCRQAVGLIWYPRKNAHAADRMLRRLARAAGTPVWNARFDHGLVGEGRMHACGVAVVNPPFGLDTVLVEPLAQLAGALAQSPRAEHLLEWIEPNEQQVFRS